MIYDLKEINVTRDIVYLSVKISKKVCVNMEKGVLLYKSNFSYKFDKSHTNQNRQINAKDIKSNTVWLMQVISEVMESSVWAHTKTQNQDHF